MSFGKRLTQARKKKGISQEEMKKIGGQEFYSSNGTAQEQGTGLGLSLIYHVIRAHSGKIEFESRLNEGAKFIIRLPVNNETAN